MFSVIWTFLKLKYNNFTISSRCNCRKGYLLDHRIRNFKRQVKQHKRNYGNDRNGQPPEGKWNDLQSQDKDGLKFWFEQMFPFARQKGCRVLSRISHQFAFETLVEVRFTTCLLQLHNRHNKKVGTNIYFIKICFGCDQTLKGAVKILSW